MDGRERAGYSYRGGLRRTGDSAIGGGAAVASGVVADAFGARGRLLEGWG
jgi:hypothetical protein